MERRNFKMGSNDCPNFFKTFIPSTCSGRLRIPPPFMKHIKHEASSLYVLKGPSENTWIVRLVKNGDYDCFEEGWPVFVKDNGMELGDICVFEYEGNLTFTVQIYDQSECDKESAFDAICSQDWIISESDKGIKKESRNEAVKVSNTVSYESPQGVSKKKGKMPACHTQARIMSRTVISSRREVTEEEKVRAIRAAKAFTSNHPFTTIVMRRSYVYYGFSLLLPRSFIGHLPEANREMILTDPKGRTWPVNYVYCNRPCIRGVLSGGWGAVSYANNIEEDDVCIFELIEEVEMRVHIFRVIEETTPLIKHSNRKRHDNCGSSDTILID